MTYITGDTIIKLREKQKLINHSYYTLVVDVLSQKVHRQFVVQGIKTFPLTGRYGSLTR